jgi:hypothetical protein
MGGQADATEDMFSKLESMRAVITEVNTQFKDPVRLRACLYPSPEFLHSTIGQDDVRLRLHIRVPLTLRDGAACTGTDGL